MIKNENGKRERGNLEEDAEFMPLSKRINNLHLTQSQLNNGSLHLNGHGQSSSTQNGESSQNGQIHPSQDPRHQEAHLIGNMNGHGLYDGKDQNSGNAYSSNFTTSANVSNICVNNQQQQHSLLNPSASSGPSINCQPMLHNGNQGQNYVHQSLSSSLNSISSISNANYPEEFRYEPVLNESANPHYYEQNRQLFQLYMERIQRYNLPPHPHFYSSSNNILDPTSNQHHLNHNNQ